MISLLTASQLKTLTSLVGFTNCSSFQLNDGCLLWISISLLLNVAMIILLGDWLKNIAHHMFSSAHHVYLLLIQDWLIYFRKTLNNNDHNQVFWARETKHPQQTIVLMKTAGQQPGSGHCAVQGLPLLPVNVVNGRINYCCFRLEF